MKRLLKEFLFLLSLVSVMHNVLADDSILIGQSGSFTGSFSEQGIAYRDGALLYFDEINQRGGINGRKIKLSSLDDKHENALAVENTKKLVKEDNVIALMNYTWTPTVRAAIPLVSKYKIAFFAPYTGAEDIYRSNNPYVFTIRASFSAELEMIIRHLATLGFKKIAVAGYSGAVGNELLEDIKRLAKNYGAKVVAAGLAVPNSGDINGAVKQLHGVDADAIVLGLSGTDAVNFIRKYNADNARKVPYFARSLIGVKQLIRDLGKDAAGISITQLVPNPYKQTMSLTKDFRALSLKKSASIAPDYLSLEGYIAARVMCEALLRSKGQPTRSGLIETMANLGKVNIGGFEINFRPGNHNGSEFVDMTMIGRDGRIIN